MSLRALYVGNPGHWVVCTGYAAVISEGTKHNDLVTSNDSWGGGQNIQTYDEFCFYGEREWKVTAK